MNFGKVIQIESQALTQELVNSLYPITGEEPVVNKDRKLLENITNLFQPYFKKTDSNFTCFIFKDAMDAFVSFANEIYSRTHNEATGLLVGYYLHDPENPEKKFVVATNFLQATGDSSNVTCEFSYEDSARHVRYCEEHHVLPIVWIHSHPGFGVFYSGTDSSTLRSYFSCNHQLGVVVDNLQNQYLGYKIINGLQTEINVWGVDFQKNLENQELTPFRYSSRDAKIEAPSKKKVSFKELQEKNPKTSTVGQPISFKKIHSNSEKFYDDIRDNLNILKEDIEALSKLIFELSKLYEIRDQEREEFSKFSLEDIKREISSQISYCAKEIKELFHSVDIIRQEVSKYETIISSLKEDLAQLKEIQVQYHKEETDITKSINDTLLSLHEICNSTKETNNTEFEHSRKRDKKLSVIIISALALSLSLNLYFFSKSLFTLDNQQDTTKTEINESQRTSNDSQIQKDSTQKNLKEVTQ